ncbi:MAG: tetratricopeptide repeat protein [Spirochaetaceae bacterium]|jgi:tetratricopeptide (TPR) repeat protein|nr:tetratricopeptide repeat protein [Spirochaetaceae bacterium]
MNRVIVFLFFLFSFSLAAQEDITILLEQAEEAYNSGDFEEAVEIYKQQILQKGYNPFGIYFNLGNAYYQRELYPQALWAYLSARKVSPLRMDISSNIQYLKREIGSDILNPKQSLLSRAVFWSPLLPLLVWQLISIVVYLLFVISLFFHKKIDSKWILGISLSFLIISLLPQWEIHQETVKPIAVLRLDSPLYQGNALFYDKVQQGVIYNAGAEIRLLEKRGSWCRVEINRDTQGWISETDLLKPGQLF